MKTRIKIVEFDDGEKLYYPQYKFLVFWFAFGEYVTPEFQRNIAFYTIKECQDFIDKRLQYQISQKVKLVTFIKYPWG